MMLEIDADSVETPKQLAARVGLSERKIRHLIATGQLEYVPIGCRIHIPRSAWPRFLNAAKRVKPWQDETRDPSSDGLQTRDTYYITWTVNGRSRKRTTGTASREEAQIVFAEWLHRLTQRRQPK